MKEECIAYVLKQTLQGLKYFHDQGQVRLRRCRRKSHLPLGMFEVVRLLFAAVTAAYLNRHML